MKYYNIVNEFEKLKNEKWWAMLIVGGRQTGKTYSTLKYCYLNKEFFCFVKRTNDDINLLCKNAGHKNLKSDLSPFKSINMDLGVNVKPIKISKGLAGFWDCKIDEDGNDIYEGAPIGYALSLNVAKDVKGFDIRECNYMIFDEFIPQPWERVNRREGEQILDVYVSINKDREQRGLQPLKLIGLANATSINNKMFEVLDVTDIMAELCIHKDSERFLKDRGIYLHKLPDNSAFIKDSENSMIYNAMKGTEWYDMAYNNNFAYNDFSSVKNNSIKKAKGVCSFLYKNKMYYVYEKLCTGGKSYHLCTSKYAESDNNFYDLSLENDQKRFYDEVLIFRKYCIENRMTFSTFSMYDLIVNYKNYFKI